MVNQFGETITEDGAKLIQERRASKAALLAEMREQRTQQALDRHSHVGAELGRLVPDQGLLYQLRKGLAELSNLLVVEGHLQGAAILASLARGVDRASHERYGPAEAPEVLTQTYAELKEAMTPQTTYPTAPDDISQLGVSTQEAAEATTAMANAGASLGTDTAPVHAKPQPMAPLTAEDASVGPLATFEDDDPDDMPGSDEPAVSPEPEDTPAREAAAQRRAAKRAQQDM